MKNLKFGLFTPLQMAFLSQKSKVMNKNQKAVKGSYSTLFITGFISLFIIASTFSSQLFAKSALAYSPSLSVNSQYGSTFTLTVTGGLPNSTFQLYYTLSGSSLPSVVSNTSWVTDYNGYYSTAINSSDYGISSGSLMYVKFYNGDQSNQVYLSGGGDCGYYGCGGSGNITFSNQNPSLSVGQNLSVNIYSNNYYSASYYISSNSNSYVTNASISGSTLNLYGSTTGSSSITVCQSNNQTCGTLYVTVGSGGAVGGITFSENNFNMYVGQSKQVTVSQAIYYTYQNYYISSNSNPSAVSASISGSNVINLYALASGSSTIYVCQSGSGACGYLYVTVSGGSNYGNITFSQSSVNLTANQSANVNIYSNNNSGSYYISTNSSSYVADAYISGSILYITGKSSGNTTITVCQNSYSNCGSVYVTVSGSSNYGNITFSQNNVNLNVGQSQNVTIYGSYNYSSYAYYISSNSNSSAVTASISGNALYLYGQGSGSATVTVCQSSSSNCGSVYVVVSGSGNYGSIWFSPSSVNMSYGQTTSVNIYGSGNYGSYYISNNSSYNVADAVISGNALNLTGKNSGNTTFTVCQYGNGGACGNLSVTVSGYYGGAGSLSFVSTSLSNLTVGQYYSYQLQASGGTPPYNFSLVSGNLPAGLSLNVNGLISGVPQYSAASSFTVMVSDNFSHTVSANFSINSSSYSYYPGVQYPGGTVAGATTYLNGQLINENGTVYIVYKSSKTGFVSASIFTALGFKFGNVLTVGNPGLADSGYVINSSRASHPWGSWVKNGQTVYFVHDSGLIPIPDWDTFINNGGQAAWIVPANSYDFSLPMLSVMGYNDARLR